MAKEPAECEYLRDGRLCRAVAEQTEGKATRTMHCTSTPKNYCCYLCGKQENCEIACSYLDDTGRPDVNLQSVKRIEGEIQKCRGEMGRLSSLLANGKIGEKSYSTANQALESKMARLESAKENPSSYPISEVSPESAGFEESSEREDKPSGLWYLVPFFFGIIGGIVGYVGTKDEDEEMATSLLVFGVVWTVILFVVYWLVLASIFSGLYR